MPICYEIEIEIERGPDDPKPGPGRFRRPIKSDRPLTTEEIETEIDKMLKKMKKDLFDYDKGDRIGSLIDYNILGIFNC